MISYDLNLKILLPRIMIVPQMPIELSAKFRVTEVMMSATGDVHAMIGVLLDALVAFTIVDQTVQTKRIKRLLGSVVTNVLKKLTNSLINVKHYAQGGS